MRRSRLLCLFLMLASVSRLAAQGDKPIDFAHDIAPLLKKHCVVCHGGDKSEGELSLNTRASLLRAKVAVPGQPKKSRLVALLMSRDPEMQMPPKGRPRLTPKELVLIRRWVSEGLKWEAGFSFAKSQYEPPLRPRRPTLPAARNGRTHPLDRILDHYHAHRKNQLPEPIDDAAFMRRLSLDLIGLPPHPDQLAAFLADKSSRKRQELIDRLLGNRQAYAEHWMTFWSDLLRNAYSGTGYIDGGRRQVTAWLYRSLLENKRYDKFVQELIAPSSESEGFIRGIKWRGNVNASQSREVQFAQSVSQVFLGINMKCASCHDSFIDRWTLKEAYGLAAIYSQRPLEIYRCDKPTGRVAKAAWIFPELGQIDAAAKQPERLRQLARLLTHPQNGRLTRTIVNRVWRQLMGRGIVHPVDAMHTRPWNEDLLDFLAVYLADNDFDLKKVIRLIASSQAYQSRAAVLSKEPGGGDYVFRGPLMKRLSAEQYLDSVWAMTGTWPQPDPRAFKRDGRQQGGQLAAVLKAHGSDAKWNDRRLRAVFTPIDPLQASLGRPNREQVVTTRPEKLTTLEAINLANGARLAEILKRGASKLAQRPEEPRRTVSWLYRYALARLPTPAEQSIAIELLRARSRQEGLEDLLWAIIMLPEFQFVR